VLKEVMNPIKMGKYPARKGGVMEEKTMKWQILVRFSVVFKNGPEKQKRGSGWNKSGKGEGNGIKESY